MDIYPGKPLINIIGAFLVESVLKRAVRKLKDDFDEN